MAATLLDLSRRGDGTWPIPAVFAEVQVVLAAWMAAANAQNPTQLLEVLTDPTDDADHLGWTVRATLAELDGGAQPVQLMSQWTAQLATGTVVNTVGLAAGHDPAGGLGAHGLLSGGQGSSIESLRPSQPFPVLGWVVSSLAAGQEFFGFCLSLHTFTNRQAVVLLIAKDVTSGQWHLHNSSMTGLPVMCAWNVAAQQEVFATSLWTEWNSGPPYTLRRPAAWLLNTPSSLHVVPLPPVKRWDPVVLPQDLATYTRTFGTGGYLKPADGSEWLLFGPGRLAVCLVDPP